MWKFKVENECERDGTALIRQQDEGFWNQFLRCGAVEILELVDGEKLI